MEAKEGSFSEFVSGSSKGNYF